MKKGILSLMITALIMVTSCKKLLDEDVRTEITDNYTNTASGFQDAVNASYSFLRNFYGANEDGASITVFGTDLFTNGFDGGNKSLNNYNSDLNPRNAVITNVWNNLYIAINTCNTAITRAPEVTGLTEELKTTRVAEARFLRAYFYFLLVQLYGPVHVTLEETKSVETSATRAPVKDVYTAIVADLEFAAMNLPVKASDYGRATKPAAENLLAKVYLTRASSEAREADDYTKAATLAEGVIKNYGFQLLDDFARVFEQGAGEKSAEVIWSVQYSNNLLTVGPGNTLHVYFLMKYDDLPGMQRDVENGRPYARFKPTDFTLNTLFDRMHDSRYEKSFKRVFYCNKPGAVTVNNKQVTLKSGDTAVYVIDRELTAAENSDPKYGVYYPPSRQNERVFPTVSKFLDPERADINELRGSRDFLCMRLAETYLIAAEALMMAGNSTDAAVYVNTVRSRAAKLGATTAETQANRLAMQVSPSQLNIDFILDERGRELLGEMERWFDLVRTNKLVERVTKYNPVAAVNIKPYHVLRPIPQDQIDRTSTGFEQNAGY